MLVTPWGIVILVRLTQFLKAEALIHVTLSGMIILVSPVQSRKAAPPMIVPLVILTVKEVESACFATVLAFVAEPVMFVSLVQPEKAPLSMFVTLSGIVTLVSPVLEKA